MNPTRCRLCQSGQMAGLEKFQNHTSRFGCEHVRMRSPITLRWNRMVPGPFLRPDNAGLSGSGTVSRGAERRGSSPIGTATES